MSGLENDEGTKKKEHDVKTSGCLCALTVTESVTDGART